MPELDPVWVGRDGARLLVKLVPTGFGRDPDELALGEGTGVRGLGRVTFLQCDMKLVKLLTEVVVCKEMRGWLSTTLGLGVPPGGSII